MVFKEAMVCDSQPTCMQRSSTKSELLNFGGHMNEATCKPRSCVPGVLAMRA